MATGKFSIGLRLGDLDDYIQPSQECIKPVQQQQQQQRPKESEKRAKIELGEGGEYVEVLEDGHRTELKAATVTLNDCLACSGCITSAESVLVTAQSASHFASLVREAKERNAPLAISIAPESLASLAAANRLSLWGAFRRFVTLFEGIGASLIVDIAFARDVLSEIAAKELCERVRSNKAEQLPMLASECPGWVCYAEKTHAAEVLPRLCKCRSAMALTGALLKRRLGRGDSIHASVAPCFDKKLEAVREDVRGVVDSVMTTAEMLDLLPPGTESFASLAEADIATVKRLCAFSNIDWDRCSSDSGDDSGVLFWSGIDGPTKHIASVAAHELLGVDAGVEPVMKTVRGRNVDMSELLIEGGSKLRFATAYGFRNIQNVVRRVKQGRYAPRFVEVMACPQSCLNGGGQLRVPKGRAPKDWLEDVRKVLESRRVVKPCDNAQAMALLHDEALLKDVSLTAEYYAREPKPAAAAAPMQIQW